MRNRTRLILLIILSVAVVSACNVLNVVEGDGEIVTETYDVSDFRAIDFAGVGNVVFTVADNYSAILTTDSNIVEYFDIRVQDNTLLIQQTDDALTLTPTDGMRIIVTAPALDALSVSGDGQIEIGSLNTDSLDIRLSSAARVEFISLIANTFSVNLSGAGSVLVRTGTATQQTIALSGSGSYDGRNFVSTSADVNLIGTGNITLNVTDSLNGILTGTGNVRYAGSPDVDIDVSGAGSVQAVGN